MPNYQAIGRYHVAAKEAGAALQQRNDLLRRAALVMNNAVASPHPPGLGRRCNFDAVRELLEEAEAANQRLLALLSELADLAPLADMPPLSLN